MARRTLGVVVGLAVWVLVVSVAGLVMRETWPSYARVADAMTFTLPMMMARLAIGAGATLAMGLATAVVSRRSLGATLAAGALLLLAFIPEHIRLWDKFPSGTTSRSCCRWFRSRTSVE
jgi:hypothetical protein